MTEATKTPEYVNVAEILAGNYEAPKTSVGGVRSDGLHLLYAGKTHSIVAAPEAGKTLAVSAMCADALAQGGSVLWIDIDYNGAEATVARMRTFGVPADVLSDASRFRLAIPTDAEQIMLIVREAWTPTVAVIDSVGELATLFDASQNDDQEYTRLHRQVVAPFTERGTAAVLIDHEAKGTDSRAYGATGTIAKKRVIDGVMYRATVLKPFVPGRGGESALSVLKDRPGYVRANSPAGHKEPNAAIFILEPLPVGVHYKFAQPHDTATPSTSDVETLHALNPAPTSVRDVKERMRWGTTRASNAWRLYQTVPGTFPTVPENTGIERSPVPLPLRGGTRNDPEERSA